MVTRGKFVFRGATTCRRCGKTVQLWITNLGNSMLVDPAPFGQGPAPTPGDTMEFSRAEKRLFPRRHLETCKGRQP